MNNNNGVENVEKQQQLAILETDEDEISVPNWLIDVLKWIARIEMANSSLSFSCKLFNRLCWTKLHGNVKPHFVQYLEFCYGPNKFGNSYGILKDRRKQIIPIAVISPPEYILGFELIIISFLDSKIIEFAKNIALKEIDLSFRTSMQKLQENNEQLILMGSLLSILAKNISVFEISNYRDINNFMNINRQFPTLIDQVSFLNVYNIVDLELDILYKWLMKPLTEGRQKILRYQINYNQIWNQRREMELHFINCIKKEFSLSTKMNNFLVKLEQKFDQFSLQNEQTREMLSLYQEMYSYGDFMINFVARYPKGEEHWMGGSLEKIRGKGKTHIILDID